MSLITAARKDFYAELTKKLLVLDDGGKPSNADKKQRVSTYIAVRLAHSLGAGASRKMTPQTTCNEFEHVTAEFLKATFLKLGDVRGPVTGTYVS